MLVSAQFWEDIGQVILQLSQDRGRRVLLVVVHAPANVAGVKDVACRQQRLQEQVAVVEFLAAITSLGLAGGDQVKRLWSDFPRVLTVIHAHQADHSEGNAAHGHERRKGDASTDEPTGTGVCQALLKCLN